MKLAIAAAFPANISESDVATAVAAIDKARIRALRQGRRYSHELEFALDQYNKLLSGVPLPAPMTFFERRQIAIEFELHSERFYALSVFERRRMQVMLEQIPTSAPPALGLQLV